MIRILFYIFIFSLTVKSRASEQEESLAQISCPEIKKEALERVKIIKSNYLTGHDSAVSLPRLRKLLSERPDCVSFKSINFKASKLEKIENFYSNFENKFDLEPAQCSTQEVDTANMPIIRGQYYLEWCYLFSAIQVLSFYEKKKLSVYAAAAKYFQDPQIHEDFILKNRRPKQNPNNEIGLIWGTLDKAVNILSNSSQQLCTEKGFYPSSEDIINFSNKIKSFISSKKSCFGGEQIFENLSAEIYEVIDKASDYNRLSILTDLTCKESVKLSSYAVEKQELPIKDNLKLFLMIDGQLEKQEPVAINIDSSMLLAGKHYRSKRTNHTTILIGRRYNYQKKQCEYLLRDSLSSFSCDKKSSIECASDKSGAIDYWVPRSTLKNNLSTVYIVKPVSN